MQVKKLIVRLREGNLYQVSVDFLRHLADKYKVKPEYRPSIQPDDAFGNISNRLESRYDFSDVELELTKQDRLHVQIWSTVNRAMEYVAKRSASEFMTVLATRIFAFLLGDVAYRLQLKTIFDQYQIPFIWGEAAHGTSPLRNLSNLVRLKHYTFDGGDLFNSGRQVLWSFNARRAGFV